jgi:O-antigen/teichoic acid export membrane protein
MYLESIVDGMLTALDEQMSVMKYNMIDAVGRLFLVMLLLPHFGMNGFLGMMYVSNLYTSLACIRKLLQVTDMQIPVTQWILLPLLAAGIAGFSVSALAVLMVGLPQLLLLTIECLLAGLIYGGCLLLQGTVTVGEILIPLRRVFSRRRRHA